MVNHPLPHQITIVSGCFRDQGLRWIKVGAVTHGMILKVKPPKWICSNSTLYVEVNLPKMAISLTANGKNDEPVDFGVPVLGQVHVF
jgi:hypothetical protein